MAGNAVLRRNLETALKARLGSLGYIKQSKELSDTYSKKSPEGRHGIRCKIDARYDVSLCLSFCLRFDVVSEVMRRINDETYRRYPDVPKVEKYYMANAYDFEGYYGELVGIYRFEGDTIEAESELEPLLQRTLQRIQDRGIPYFEKYGKLDEVVRIIVTDSHEWKFLKVSPCDFAVTAAATLFAVKGSDSMLEYVNRRSTDPNLNKLRKEQLEMLVELSKASGSQQ